jgi:hypothetical protein
METSRVGSISDAKAPKNGAFTARAGVDSKF